MFTVSLVTMSLAACSFLSYVFMQFCRELMHAGKNSTRSAQDESRYMRPELSSMMERSAIGRSTTNPVPRPAHHSRKVWSGNEEAVMRKQMVTSLVVGVIGLLAPYIVVLLLHSSSPLGR
jgi:hypothetical protein